MTAFSSCCKADATIRQSDGIDGVAVFRRANISAHTEAVPASTGITLRTRTPSSLTFHVEHIKAPQPIGADPLDNLPLVCPDCNRSKVPNLVTLDPETRASVQLFHPRRDQWEGHFDSLGTRFIGKTAAGTATIHLLQRNSVELVEMRAERQALKEM